MQDGRRRNEIDALAGLLRKEGVDIRCAKAQLTAPGRTLGRCRVQGQGSAARVEFSPVRRLEPQLQAKLLAVEANRGAHVRNVLDGIDKCGGHRRTPLS